MSRDEGIVDASAAPAVGIKSRGDVLCATHGRKKSTLTGLLISKMGYETYSKISAAESFVTLAWLAC